MRLDGAGKTLALVIALMFAGCGPRPAPDSPEGSGALALTLAPGVTVNSVIFQITGNGITPIVGTIDVTNATAATATSDATNRTTSGASSAQRV